MNFESETSSSSSATPIEKEQMFDKVVTPSDVGKLNRLVIPKQHAERYFPLDTSTNEKGLLLNFEDRTGKPWRFRYSYWNSSQSYVMTKGWSRFVKEKKLDAGDTVSFGRGINEKDRFFIDWKRRPEVILHGPPRFPRVPLPLPPPRGSNYPPMVSFTRSVGGVPWAGRLLVPTSQNNYLYNVSGDSGGGSGQYLVYRSALAPPQVTVGKPMVLDSVPVIQRQASAKRVRLFGVNLDSPDLDADVLRSRISSSSSPLPSPKGKEQQKEEPSLDLEM